MGQYELRDLMERCGYNDRFREASFLFQYYRFGKFYDEIFMKQPTAPVQVQPLPQTTSSSSSSSSSTSWDRAMASLPQVANASTLPPVAEHEDDPDLGLPDDSTEITQSEPETNVNQSEVAHRKRHHLPSTNLMLMLAQVMSPLLRPVPLQMDQLR